MKIDKKNPEHLFVLMVSGVSSTVSVLFRCIFNKKKDEKIIVFYGHTLNGNLKAFYDYLYKKRGYKVYFLVLDRGYYKRLVASVDKPETILNSQYIKDMLTVAKSDAIITSHGLHFFAILRLLTNIKFIDVWHAVSFKGFADDDFKHLHRHDEIWVSSLFMKDMYINRYGFATSRVKITGYGRTDQLVDGSLIKKRILKKYSIPSAKKYILIAPTWKQDSKNRSILPFGMTEQDFFADLDDLARQHSAHIIFRTHLNSSEELQVNHLTNIAFMPYGRYEVVEEFLYISDILVTDWSSVGIDFLPLKRPTIFLDVDVPFKHGFNLGPEHRFGDVVSSFEELKSSLEKYLSKPELFLKVHKKDMERTTEIAYGNSLDGHSLDRYNERLEELLR